MNFKSRTRSMFIFGALLVLIIVGVATFAPLIAPMDPNEMSLKDRFQGPQWQHPFGTDQNGSDIFSKVIYGARVSLFISISVVFINACVGLVLGSLAGYMGRWVDIGIMRVTDMFLAFPTFLLALGIVAIMGPSLKNLVFAMCITGWTSYARLVRGEVFHLKEREYVQSSLALGNTHFRILTLHIWPNLLGPLVVYSTFAMAGVIVAESGLSFLGLGAPITTPTWGSLLSTGRHFLYEAPHMSIFPGLAILMLVMAFNLIGESLRMYLDPNKT